MKKFEMRDVVAAQDYAMDGGTALHVHTLTAGHPLFKRYAVIGHLIDQDKRRLVHLASRLGVRVVKVEREGRRGQHVDLCGKPFERACEMAEALLHHIPYAEALDVAEMLVSRLGSACERIEISGELRREEHEIHRIDILAEVSNCAYLIPRLVSMMTEGLISYDRLRARSMKFRMLKPDVPVQVYQVFAPATWGVRSIMLTGPVDFAHWMVSHRAHGGALPNHLFVKNGAVHNKKTNQRPRSAEEADYFELCGLPWIRPQFRVARWSK